MRTLTQKIIEKSVRIFVKSGNYSLCIFIEPSWWNFDIRNGRVLFWQDPIRLKRSSWMQRFMLYDWKNFFVACCSSWNVVAQFLFFTDFDPLRLCVLERCSSKLSRKRASSIHNLMEWVHYVFVWDAEISCSFVWILKGSIHNYSLLVSDPFFRARPLIKWWKSYPVKLWKNTGVLFFVVYCFFFRKTWNLPVFWSWWTTLSSTSSWLRITQAIRVEQR